MHFENIFSITKTIFDSFIEYKDKNFEIPKFKDRLYAIVNSMKPENPDLMVYIAKDIETLETIFEEEAAKMFPTRSKKTHSSKLKTSQPDILQSVSESSQKLEMLLKEMQEITQKIKNGSRSSK